MCARALVDVCVRVRGCVCVCACACNHVRMRVCSFTAKADGAMETIRAQTPDAILTGIPLDLSSIHSIHR